MSGRIRSIGESSQNYMTPESKYDSLDTDFHCQMQRNYSFNNVYPTAEIAVNAS